MSHPTNQIMSDYGSCRISSANDCEEQISSLPIRHNQERQSDAKKAKTSSQGLNRAVLVSGGATLYYRFCGISEETRHSCADGFQSVQSLSPSPAVIGW
jgi:hypothetical protein